MVLFGPDVILVTKRLEEVAAVVLNESYGGDLKSKNSNVHLGL